MGYKSFIAHLEGEKQVTGLNFSEFRKKIRQILAVALPSGTSITNQAHSMAGDIQIGRTAFMDKMGVDSELAYKKQCLKDNRIIFHAHIGMGSWEATAEALAHLQKTAEQSEIIIDRAGICLDRRMGLPKSRRKKIPAETGPMLDNNAQWMQVGQGVPIQPHRGDFMIGFPASTDVHEHAIMIIHQLLAEAGADMINLGAEADPDQIIIEAQRRAHRAKRRKQQGTCLNFSRQALGAIPFAITRR